MKKNLKEAGHVQMSAAGSQSPVIQAGGDVVINYGLTKEALEELLRQQRKGILESLQHVAAKERFLLEQELQAVQEKLANIEKSYQEELMRRKAADEALGRLQGQLPHAQIEKAQDELRQGNVAAAEQAFDEVVDKAGKSVAMAAHQSGQIAEGRLDYAKAMRQYKKAAALEEDNPDYLLAAGCMDRTLADYAHAQEWLKRLMNIRGAQGREDVDQARAMHELAGLYMQQGNHAQAEPLYTQALDILKAAFPEGHPDIEVVQGNYANLKKKADSSQP